MSNCAKCREFCELVSIECIIDETPLTPSVNTKQIENARKQALEDHVKPLMNKNEGTCFDDLCAAIEEDGVDGLSKKWAAMRKAILPLVSWATFLEWLIWNGNKEYSKIGVSKKTPAGGEVVNADELRDTIKEARLKVEAKQNNWEDWVDENEDDYTCIKSTTGDCCDDSHDIDLPVSVV